MRDPLKYTVIFLSFIAAWLLMIIPMPATLHWIRPEWITLMLIYWAYRAPEVVGVGTAWSVGLIMDVLNGTLLGQYALSMAIVVGLAEFFKHRIRIAPLWHQVFIILVLVGFGKLSLLMVQWLLGHPPTSLWYWASAVTSMLMWPWISHVLRYYGRKTL